MRTVIAAVLLSVIVASSGLAQNKNYPNLHPASGSHIHDSSNIYRAHLTCRTLVK